MVQKRPNAWGLFDMQGNEMEWCLDPYEEPDAGPGANASDRRVLRGGGFLEPAEMVRPACRFVSHRASPTHGSFRVVCLPDGEAP